jgi:uncharacterized protein with PIN domain
VLVVDTGVFLAAADRNDPDHPVCRDLLGEHPGPLITTAAVVAETGWLIDRRLGAATEAAFYRSVASGGFKVENFGADDWTRVAELVLAYADSPAVSAGKLPKTLPGNLPDQLPKDLRGSERPGSGTSTPSTGPAGRRVRGSA